MLGPQVAITRQVYGISTYVELDGGGGGGGGGGCWWLRRLALEVEQ